MKRLIALVLVAFASGGCASEPESFATVRQVVTAMRDAGIDCAGLNTVAEPRTRSAGRRSLLKQRGVCSVDGESVVIGTFEDSDRRADWLAVGGRLGPVAVGPNWVATSRSGKVVAQVVDALDASSANHDM